MAVVLQNKKLDENIYILTLEGNYSGRMGQFYMIRAWDKHPFLSRPLSIHDISEGSISFLYHLVGEGTRILSTKREGDTVDIHGPYGNGFPIEGGNIALVGGGMGTAPLLFAAKQLKSQVKVDKLDIYIGFREKIILQEEFELYAENLYCKNSGFITDILKTETYNTIYACGPAVMMKKVVDMAKGSDTKVYVSVENNMACGVGACLGCTCKTKQGNKKVCVDGPVFLGEDIYET